MTCADCEVETVPQKQWQQMPLAERRASGKRRRCGRYCKPCFERRSRQNEHRRWRTAELVEEAELLFSDGLLAAEVARRLGIKHASLIQAYRRARLKGLTTRRPDYRGTRELH